MPMNFYATFFMGKQGGLEKVSPLEYGNLWANEFMTKTVTGKHVVVQKGHQVQTWMKNLDCWITVFTPSTSNIVLYLKIGHLFTFRQGFCWENLSTCSKVDMFILSQHADEPTRPGLTWRNFSPLTLLIQGVLPNSHPNSNMIFCKVGGFQKKECIVYPWSLPAQVYQPPPKTRFLCNFRG